MRVVAICTALLLGSAGLVAGQDKLVRTQGAPPQFAVVEREKDGEWELVQTHVRHVFTQELRTVEKDGVPETVQVTVCKPVYEQSVRKFSPKLGGKIYDVKGKSVAIAKAKDRLEAGRTVLVSADGKKVDGRYLRVVRPDTLILVQPLDAAVGK